ncbi:MAG: BT0820 family HAD-type phosphatase [Mesonia hippocampi]|uniref:BT0820 family HAD-type phosphatase n=1 Tax=Mesonia hippocampi TaxID=1628250 RepID=UPI003F9BE16B
MTKAKIIAIDFDGTIVEHKYPKIGKEMLFAFDTIKALEAKGHKLILWTYRTGKELQEAVEFCKRNGVTFFAINENYPKETTQDNYSRKINADIFIDDRNIGGFLGWDTIWQHLHPEGKEFLHLLKNKKAHFNYKKTKLKLW